MHCTHFSLRVLACKPRFAARVYEYTNIGYPQAYLLQPRNIVGNFLPRHSKEQYTPRITRILSMGAPVCGNDTAANVRLSGDSELRPDTTEGANHRQTLDRVLMCMYLDIDRTQEKELYSIYGDSNGNTRLINCVGPQIGANITSIAPSPNITDAERGTFQWKISLQGYFPIHRVSTALGRYTVRERATLSSSQSRIGPDMY